jgi:hypothetical protein
MHYVRMYADADGVSHFEDVDVEFALGDYSPPTPPVYVSPFAPAFVLKSGIPWRMLPREMGSGSGSSRATSRSSTS